MNDDKSFQPATTITQAYNAVNPEQSLEPGDPRYVDFAAQRGDEHPVSVIVKRILRSEANQPVRHLKQLLAGHRGCGKTTELLLLKERLEKENFFVVYFDAASEIDMNDVDYSDLLLATMHQLHLQVEQSPLQLFLDIKRLDDIALRLGRVILEKEEREDIEATLKTEYRVGAEIPLFVKMMAAFKGFITSGSTQKKHIRVELQQRTSLFLQDLNDLIDKLQQQLRDKGKRGLVIIIDSLDRIIPHSLGDERKSNSHTALYLDHVEHLKAPRCHLVYTVPISIFFHENVSKAYPDGPLTIPMIKTREENGEVCDDGVRVLHEAIASRIDIGKIFVEVRDVETFCLASGGHLRDLLRLVRYACDYSDEQITSDAAARAVRSLVQEYDRLVKDADLPKLVRVHREKRLPSDSEFALLPYHLIVLEYQNHERWADLHPAVQETRKFREAWKNAQRQNPQNKTGKKLRQTRRAAKR